MVSGVKRTDSSLVVKLVLRETHQITLEKTDAHSLISYTQAHMQASKQANKQIKANPRSSLRSKRLPLFRTLSEFQSYNLLEKKSSKKQKTMNTEFFYGFNQEESDGARARERKIAMQIVQRVPFVSLST